MCLISHFLSVAFNGEKKKNRKKKGRKEGGREEGKEGKNDTPAS